MLNFPVMFAYLIGESRLFRHIVTFLIITAPTSITYLLISFLLVLLLLLVCVSLTIIVGNYL